MVDNLIETTAGVCKIVCEDVSDAIVFECSPDAGLMGNIIGWLLVDDLGMEEIGYVESSYLPPLAILHDGLALHPVRIYRKDNVVLFLSDVMFPADIVHDLTTVMCEWMLRNNSRKFLTFNSLIVQEKTEAIRGVGNCKESLDIINELDVPLFSYGMLKGLSGTLLSKGSTYNIPGVCFLGETLNQYPDPRAAADLVEVINRVLGTDISNEPLIKEAEAIESRVAMLSEQHSSDDESPLYM